MRYMATLLAVRDMAASVRFYQEVLGLEVLQDFGANVTLTGGIALQILETWREFIGGKAVTLPGHGGSSILRKGIWTVSWNG